MKIPSNHVCNNCWWFQCKGYMLLSCCQNYLQNNWTGHLPTWIDNILETKPFHFRSLLTNILLLRHVLLWSVCHLENHDDSIGRLFIKTRAIALAFGRSYRDWNFALVALKKRGFARNKTDSRDRFMKIFGTLRGCFSLREYFMVPVFYK